MIEENKSIVDCSTIDREVTELANQVLQETDVDKTKDLIALFNWNLSKKNVSRLLKLNNLYDAVSDQMVTRFATRSDQFTNSDLLDYLKTVQGAIDTSAKNLSQAEEAPPTIVHNNTQINVNVVDSFDRDAKERILAAITETINNAKNVNKNNDDVIEVEATENNSEETK